MDEVFQSHGRGVVRVGGGVVRVGGGVISMGEARGGVVGGEEHPERREEGGKVMNHFDLWAGLNRARSGQKN